MAKKNNRTQSKTSSKSSAAKRSTTPLVADPELPAVVVEPKAPAKAPRLSRQQASIEQLKDEYAYVTQDLKKVFILAAAMFALLIVANLILPILGV